MSEQGSPQDPEPETGSPSAEAQAPSPRRGLGTGAKAALIAVGSVALLAVSGISGYAIGHATADRSQWHAMAEHGPYGTAPGWPGAPGNMSDGDRHHGEHHHGDGRGPDGRGHGHHDERMPDEGMPGQGMPDSTQQG